MSLIAPKLHLEHQNSAENSQSGSKESKVSLYPPDIYVNPGLMRFTYDAFPRTVELYRKWTVPPAVIAESFTEEAQTIPLIDFSQPGKEPVRCSKCATYINPFAAWHQDQRGLFWVCNMCGTDNQCPLWYYPSTAPHICPGTTWRQDYREHPELFTTAVDIIPPAEYFPRPPPQVKFVFLIDVTQPALESGFVDMAVQSILDSMELLQEIPDAKVGLIAFNSAIHAIVFPHQGDSSGHSPHIETVASVDDPFLASSRVLVSLATHYELLCSALRQLPTMFSSYSEGDSTSSGEPKCCLYSAIITAGTALVDGGGHAMIFASSLPTVGRGVLKHTPRFTASMALKPSADVGLSGYDAPVSQREEHELLKDTQGALLGPRLRNYYDLAQDARAKFIAFDFFCCPPPNPLDDLRRPRDMDLATLAVLPHITGGDLVYIPGFMPGRDGPRLNTELRRALSRPFVLEPISRLRTADGIVTKAFYGNCDRLSTDLCACSGIDSDKCLIAELELSDPALLQGRAEVCVQWSTMYTDKNGAHRLRIVTARIPLVDNVTDIMRLTDVDATTAFVMKRAAAQLLGISQSDGECQGSGLNTARFGVIRSAVGIISEWRRVLQTVNQQDPLFDLLDSKGALFPLYMFGILRSNMLSPPLPSISDDERAACAFQLLSQRIAAARYRVYSRVYCLDDYLAARMNGETPHFPAQQRLSLAYLPGGLYFVEDTNAFYLFIRTWNIVGTTGCAQVPLDSQKPGIPSAQLAISQCIRRSVVIGDAAQIYPVTVTEGNPTDLLSGAKYLLDEDTPAGRAIADISDTVSAKRHTVLPLYVIIEGGKAGTDVLVHQCMTEDRSPDGRPGLAWFQELLSSPSKISDILAYRKRNAI